MHLQAARIACLWTNADARSKGRTILATAEIPQAKGWGFSKARQEVQNLELCGGEVDFLLTFSAPLTADLDDASFCALVEHELYHCGQARDQWGSPRFTREGRPVFSMRGHDSEEFVGVVRRYGTGAVDGGTRMLVEAAKRAPEVARANVAAACGTCLARVA